MQNKHMENLLSTPVKEVLAIAQRHICERAKYAGILALKCPNDFWVYQEIIFEVKPSIIIEIGNYRGGSTLALADLMERFSRGRVIGIDINHDLLDEKVKNDPRITFLTGDASSLLSEVQKLISPEDQVLIIEDSSHTYENTLKILRGYSSFISTNSYFIVEDGICHHGIEEGPNPGPFEAIQTFLEENKNFVADRDREGFVITWNPNGYLKRIS